MQLIRAGFIAEVEGAMQERKVVLIGGTSNVGKTTLGRKLADELGWNYASTDQLARHPGRPWAVGDGGVAEHVARHYREHTIAELVDSVLLHYRTIVWPIIDAKVRARLNNPFDDSLVLEGSAILPELVTKAKYQGASAVWLTAPADVITARIHTGSNFSSCSPLAQQLVNAFIARTLAIDQLLNRAVNTHSQISLDASSPNAYAELRQVLFMPG